MSKFCRLTMMTSGLSSGLLEPKHHCETSFGTLTTPSTRPGPQTSWSSELAPSTSTTKTHTPRTGESKDLVTVVYYTNSATKTTSGNSMRMSKFCGTTMNIMGLFQPNHDCLTSFGGTKTTPFMKSTKIIWRSRSTSSTETPSSTKHDLSTKTKDPPTLQTTWLNSGVPLLATVTYVSSGSTWTTSMELSKTHAVYYSSVSFRSAI